MLPSLPMNIYCVTVKISSATQIGSKVTEISKISVVMYVSDQFVDGQLQLTDYRDPSTQLGF